MNWYSLYKIAFRNPLDLLTNKITPIVIEKLKETINTNKEKFTFYLSQEDINEFLNFNIVSLVVFIKLTKSNKEEVTINAHFNASKRSIYLQINVFSENFIKKIEEISQTSSYKIRHELEHSIQKIVNIDYDREKMFNANRLDAWILAWQKYLSNEEEINAHVREFMFKSKKERIPIEKLIKETLYDKLFGTYKGEATEKINKKTREGIIYLNTYNSLVKKYLEILSNIHQPPRSKRWLK